ncbi:MAG: response regulator [Leptothrix ochracea]|uniref:LuxR C-terminal-related transcriptional regulator n=1 Tax=Leptothrix ochracea TaxID=735331 RepID=UPI0034E21F4D
MEILMVDDHVLFRDGLALMMTQCFPHVVLREAASLSSAIKQLRRPPAVEMVLLDLGLSDSSGLDSIDRLRKIAPDVTLIVLSGDDRPETVVASIERGAAGFIPKTARSGVIETGLRTVIEGGVYIPRAAVQLVRGVAPEEGKGWAEVGLSQRQIEVLYGLSAGDATKTIARHMNVAESTIKTHLVGIYRKLGVTSRTEAVLAAARYGLLDNLLSTQRHP